MTASELRIGNLVYKMVLNVNSGKYEFPVTEVDYHIIHDVLHNKGTYNAIPLTEEWLLKFGFKKKGEWMCIDFNPRMGIRFYNGNSAECDITQDDKYIAFKAGHIKYVHQLQNLYFALTGTELTISE